jgi:hypothetical protein
MWLHAVATQTIHCMRHGLTEMNVYLKQFAYDASTFKDPMMYVWGDSCATHCMRRPTQPAPMLALMPTAHR